MEAYNIRRIGSSEGLNGRPISIKPIGETKKRERMRNFEEENTLADLPKQNTYGGIDSRSPRGLDNVERLFASTSKDFFPSSTKGFEQQHLSSTIAHNRDLAEVEEEEKGANGFFPPIKKRLSGNKLDDVKFSALGEFAAR